MRPQSMSMTFSISNSNEAFRALTFVLGYSYGESIRSGAPDAQITVGQGSFKYVRHQLSEANY